MNGVGNFAADGVTNVFLIQFGGHPRTSAVSFALREHKYHAIAAYYHFGRRPFTKDGRDTSKFASMDKAYNYLSELVD